MNLIYTFILFLLRFFIIEADKDLRVYSVDSISTNLQDMSGLNIAIDIIIMILDSFCIAYPLLIYSNIIYCDGKNDNYLIDSNLSNIRRNNQQYYNRTLSNIYRLNILNRNVENNRIFKKELIMVE